MLSSCSAGSLCHSSIIFAPSQQPQDTFLYTKWEAGLENYTQGPFVPQNTAVALAAQRRGVATAISRISARGAEMRSAGPAGGKLKQDISETFHKA